jgi:hypothetical protein
MSRLAAIFVALVLALAVSPAHAQGWSWPWERPTERTYYVEWPWGGRIWEYRSTTGELPRMPLFPQSEPSPLTGWSGPVHPLVVPSDAPVNRGWLSPLNPQPAPASQPSWLQRLNQTDQPSQSAGTLLDRLNPPSQPSGSLRSAYPEQRCSIARGNC